MNKRGSIRYYTIPAHGRAWASLNGIIRSRFIGYNLSLLKHPFISAAKLQKIYEIHQVKHSGLQIPDIQLIFNILYPEINIS